MIGKERSKFPRKNFTLYPFPEILVSDSDAIMCNIICRLITSASKHGLRFLNSEALDSIAEASRSLAFAQRISHQEPLSCPKEFFGGPTERRTQAELLERNHSRQWENRKSFEKGGNNAGHATSTGTVNLLQGRIV